MRESTGGEGRNDGAFSECSQQAHYSDSDDISMLRNELVFSLMVTDDKL